MANWLSQQNKYLKVKDSVVLTPIIDYAIAEVDKYFSTCPSFVTSGLRDPDAQLRVIRSYLTLKGLDKKFPETMICKVTDTITDSNTGKMIYAWQYGWSNLLSNKVIINPPLPAIVLTDYFGPTGVGKNLKGIVIRQTPHATGTAFNVGGGNNGPSDEAACIKAAMAGGCKSIVSYLLERENNALHVNCKHI